MYKYFALMAVIAARGANKSDTDLYVTSNEKVWYTTLNDVALVNFRESQLNFHDFQHANFISNSLDEALPIADVRKALFTYSKARLFVNDRSPPRDGHFDREWNHLSDVIAHKAIKDIMIKDYIQAADSPDQALMITLAETKRLFFEKSAGQKSGLKP